MYGMTALHREVRRLASSTKLEVLLQNGANTEIGENSYDEKPLHTAASCGCERGVKILLESGANVNAKDVNDLTPLSRAAMVKSPGVVKLLLEKGASPDLQDRFGGSPLTRARGLIFSTIVIGLIEKMSKLARQRELKLNEKNRKAEKDRELKSKKTGEVKEDKIQRRTRILTSSRKIVVWWPLRSPKAVDGGPTPTLSYKYWHTE